MKTRNNKEKGAMIVLVALAMPVLLGGIGLVMDNGVMYNLKRRAQAAADASAIAAAQEIRLENHSGIKGAAVHDAELNGFVHGGDTEVLVNQPPQFGRFAGDSDYVEVIVRERSPLLFMAALTDTRHEIQGRAVAGVVASNNCTWTLDKEAKNSFNVVGTSSVTFNNCGLHVNSNHIEAARTAGGAQVNATSVDVVGDYVGVGFSPTPRTDAHQIEDPFAELAPPVFSNICDHVRFKADSQTTMNPGVYCGGITFNAQADVTLNPGVYILMGGGLTSHGQSQIFGDGVTFYNTERNGYPYSPITMNAGTVVDLTAPSTGPMKGMLFFEDRDVESNRVNVLNGGASVQLKGALYFPSTDLKLSGTFDGVGNKMAIAAMNLEVAGNVAFEKFNLDFLPPAMADARVVE